MSSERNLTSFIPFIFLTFASLLALVRGQVRQYHFCLNNGNYTSNSTYQVNLSSILSSSYTNIGPNGFYNDSMGQNPDRANVIALCRGDRQLDICRSCVQNATVDLVRLCPNQRQAFFIEEYCMLRYSDEPIFGTLSISRSYHVYNLQNATSPNEFMRDLRTLLDSLRGQAANGGSLLKVAAGNLSSSDFLTIYALVQCTPDLSANDCTNCLISSAQQLPRCCNTSIGVRIQNPSCNLRYEIARFYNETRIQELISVSTPPLPAPTVPAPPVLTPPLPSPPGNRANNTTRIIIIIISVVVGLLLAIFVGFLLRNKIKQNPNEAEPGSGNKISSIESLQYDFGKIKTATDNFSEANKLGQGGFGAVYQGKLPNGHHIAVKRLSKNSGQGDIEFKNEVVLLAKLQHRNLVRLLGFCLQGIEKILVYEFLQNSSLDHFIFDPIKRSFFNWETRYKIIAGIAKGLLYLHEDSRLRIIHRDLKPSNVLLDGEMNPKIADFGMARLFVPDETQGKTSRIVGTYGYMAPEYAGQGQISVKLDVFSFGVLVLEIISGQKNNNFRNQENVEDLLITSAWINWRNGMAANVVDHFLRGGSGMPSAILRCIHISLLCVQENAVDRPTMASVVLMLNSNSITLPIPSKPAYFLPSDADLEISDLREQHETARLVDPSINDVSITELDPR